MNASCPKCTEPVELVQSRRGKSQSNWWTERYRCERCKLDIMVKYQIKSYADFIPGDT